jgi:hypothetical protein
MSSISLYELADEFKIALEELTDLDDEYILDTLESIQGEFKLKSINVAKFIRNLEHTAEGIKEIERKQTDRRKNLEQKILRLKEYLKSNLENVGLDKIENDELVIALQKNPHKVSIIDEQLIPKEYFEIQEQVSINKTKIKEDLKNGIDIPGCEMIQEKRLNIK